MKKSILFVFFVLSTICVNANHKYWIFLKDKGQIDQCRLPLVSDECMRNRLMFKISTCQFTDYPVSQHYVDAIRSLGIQIVVKSKWLNAVSVHLTTEQLNKVRAFTFVDRVVQIRSRQLLSADTPSKIPKQLSTSIDLMSGNSFIKAGLNGENVKLGVIDAGFDYADKDSALVTLFRNKKNIHTKDFLNPQHDSLFFEPLTKSDSHGTEVLMNIGGKTSGNNTVQYGLATHVQLYLARTEDGDHESRSEEDLWIAAIEWMDSLGVRLVSTSLGYGDEMDNPDENYLPSEMDGKTSRISKAAQIAVNEKGMLLVVAAGNEGRKNDWKVVTAPGDAEGVVSVGAVYQNCLKTGYSSIGSQNVSFIKPNVSTFSLTGTSFSAPAIAGFVACMMQKNPQLSSDSIKSILYQSSHLYPYGNNFIGYGIPQADIALHILDGNQFAPISQKVKVGGESVTLNVEDGNITPLIAFHKINHQHVAFQEELELTTVKTFWQKIFFRKATKHLLTIERKNGIAFTTLQIGFTVFEFEW
jgi:subtilisin family serine protease